jgi:outer membrane scaffolding protein for murein synthesis (MipA/OmpV family)
MKLDSKIFDRIRVKPDQDRLLRERSPKCEWNGCDGAGVHRAPKGRGHDGEYHLFCMDHVRRYNKSYNYFTGMSDADVIGYQNSARTGHRPTWKMGANPWKDEVREHAHEHVDPHTFGDAFGLFGEMEFDNAAPRRTVRNAERRALVALGLDETATAIDIKGRYKQLVKRLHPDANNGRREQEDKLREVIQSYSYLRSVGFC